MAGSTYGNIFKISTWGESHGKALGVVVDGCPAGINLCEEDIQKFLNRRKPGQSKFTTQRNEDDKVEILSGVFNGKTTGTPISMIVKNKDHHSADYTDIASYYRPGHADFTAWVKYKGANDHRGGGHFSGRLTAPLCFAGAVCMQILERRGIHIGAHILSIKGVQDTPFDAVAVDADTLKAVTEKVFPVQNDAAGEKMQATIAAAKENADSVGGVIECAVVGLPVGVGEPMFDGLESRLAAAIYAIPAVKGVEFGEGFGVAALFGSENNDNFTYQADGTVRTTTNHHGGSLGGISSGMPLVLRAAFKPTPSIGQTQDTISISKGENDTLAIVGRHDPCIVPRAVPCVEAAAAVALLDLICRMEQ
mgnify:FL=1